jgi:hypothetical protein
MGETTYGQLLKSGEIEVLDSTETYFRQCHPSFYDEETQQPTSQMLGNFPVDRGMLSGSRSSLRTPMQAYLDFKGRSAGTWGVPVGDVQQAGCCIVDDHMLPSVPHGHAYLDTRHLLSDRAERRKAMSQILIGMHKGGRLAPDPIP